MTSSIESQSEGSSQWVGAILNSCDLGLETFARQNVVHDGSGDAAGGRGSSRSFHTYDPNPAFGDIHRFSGMMKHPLYV